MIHRLRGQLVEKDVEGVVVDVGGVGYRASASSNTLRALPPVGEECVLHTRMVVREDAMLLFGFADREERAAFDSLTTVSKIGPKLALSILSALSPQEVAEAVGRGDIVKLASVPGLGKKTAERLVLELRGKNLAAFDPGINGGEAGRAGGEGGGGFWGLGGLAGGGGGGPQTGAAGIERPLDPAEDVEDDEPTLRPRTLDEFVGQEELKQNLRIFVEAAKRRGGALRPMALAGPPGLGKTSMCRILAGEMGVDIQVTSGPSLERAGDMAAILTQLEEGDFLFIDEIHRLNRQIEEVLYPAMEDFVMDIVLGQGPSARTIRMDLPKFTLVGATTRTGLMTKPLLDRFGVSEKLDYYGPEELQKIVVRAAGILDIPI